MLIKGKDHKNQGRIPVVQDLGVTVLLSPF